MIPHPVIKTFRTTENPTYISPAHFTGGAVAAMKYIFVFPTLSLKALSFATTCYLFPRIGCGPATCAQSHRHHNIQSGSFNLRLTLRLSSLRCFAYPNWTCQSPKYLPSVVNTCRTNSWTWLQYHLFLTKVTPSFESGTTHSELEGENLSKQNQTLRGKKVRQF